VSLILLDIMLPGVMNGFDMCRAIRDDSDLSDTPVILLSALTDAADVMQGINADADYYLTKPWKAEFLLAKVKSILTAPCRRRDKRNTRRITWNSKTKYVTLL